jgi:hypothetical protein
MTRSQACAFLELFPVTPIREVDGQILDTVPAWASYLFSHWTEEWQLHIADVSRREGLTMTPQACAHLAAFEQNPPPPRPRDYEERVLSFMATLAPRVHGDVEAVEVVARVLAYLPTRPSEHFARVAYMLAGGISTAGWTARMALPGDGLLVYLSSDSARVVAHEVAHAWADIDETAPPVPGMDAISLARVRRVLEARRLPGDLDVLEYLDESERRTGLLTRAWALPFSPTECAD